MNNPFAWLAGRPTEIAIVECLPAATPLRLFAQHTTCSHMEYATFRSLTEDTDEDRYADHGQGQTWAAAVCAEAWLAMLAAGTPKDVRREALARLEARLQVPIVTCTECGRQDDHAFVREARARSLCFSCMHWADLAAAADQSRHVRVRGVHYKIGEERHGGQRVSGYGGDRFVVRFLDGREVATTNLWCQGTIPWHWQDRLPDNATFVGGAP